jgi:hypothetical protein
MYIFCPKLSQISRREIATFAKEGIFVEDLVFQPSPEELVAETQDWSVF